MSATPEQIAVELDEFAGEQEAKSAQEWLASMAAAYLNEAKQLRAAAALIRAQAERVRVLEEALNIIAQWDSFSPPLTKNDANIPPEDFPHYVAGRAHAELALIRNYASKSIARAALKAAP